MIRRGDLVQVISGDDHDKVVYAWGIYLGKCKTWKEWHLVQNQNGKAYQWDEPYWEVKKIKQTRQQ